jgi:hypothetical protein
MNGRIITGVTSETELAYCAGIIDADGWIGVKRSSYAVRVVKDSAQPTYGERVRVKQVELPAVALLHDIFGGTIRLERPTAARGRRLHSWQVGDKLAATCLSALLPYLRIKQAQAKNCLFLRSLKEASKSARIARGRAHAGAAPRSQRISDVMESIFLTAKSLNSVGVQ